MLPIDPVCDVFPPMPERDFEDLVADIRDRGVLVPIVTWQGKVIDGRNRALACDRLGIEPPTQEWDGQGSKLMFVLSMNMHRRHLTESQRAACAADAKQFFVAEAKARQDVSRKRRGKADPEPAEPSRPARADMAAVFGVSERSIQRAIKVQEENPELHEQVKAGRTTVAQAERSIVRAEKRQILESKAAEAKASGGCDVPYSIRVGDVIEVAKEIPDGSARLVFADPPYNEGVDYGNGKDADLKTPQEYQDFCMSWMREAGRILTPDGSFWTLISEDWADYFGVWLRLAGFHRRRWVVWYESFGQNAEDNFTKSNRHLFYCVKNRKEFVFNRDAVRRVSWREKNGDKRACPDGAVMDATWTDIPRVMDNHPGRMVDFPTQLPVALLAPIVGVSTYPGDTVVDLFSGSGSLGEACILDPHGPRTFVGIEQNPHYAKMSAARLDIVLAGRAKVDPVASAK
jgi:DNA modification methylase